MQQLKPQMSKHEAAKLASFFESWDHKDSLPLQAMTAYNQGRASGEIKDPDENGVRAGLSEFIKSRADQPYYEILKTFETSRGEITDVLDRTGGSALEMQSIDPTMVVLMEDKTQYQFLNTCDRMSVRSMLLEYNRMLAPGHNRTASSFVAEAADPGFDTAVIDRQADTVGFMAEAFSITHPYSKVDTMEDGMVIQEMAAMKRMLRTAASALWYGNKDVAPLEFNGFETILESESEWTHDAKGKFPEPEQLQIMGRKIYQQGFGVVNGMWMSHATKNSSDVNYLTKDTMRWNVDSGRPGDYVGPIVPGHYDQNARDGKVPYFSDFWLRRSLHEPPAVYQPSSKTFEENPEGKNPPGTPTATAVNAGATAGSRFYAADIPTIPTVVKYKLVGISDEGGRSKLSEEIVETGGPLAAGQAINLTIEPGAGPNYTTGYELWRETVIGNGKFVQFKRIPRNPAGPTVFQDINQWRPGTEIGILGDFNSRGKTGELRTYACAELMPPLKTTFARGAVSMRNIPGMLEWYLGFRVYAPNKFFYIYNLPVADLD